MTCVWQRSQSYTDGLQ